MWKKRFFALVLLVVAGGIGFFAHPKHSPNYPYRLGLDLSGGTHLVYQADTSKVATGEVANAMTALQEVVERRVNLFGVSEPLVQIEQGGTVGAPEQRLIVELPGITNVTEAVKLIGKTPSLEFRLLRPGVDKLSKEELEKKTIDEVFLPAELTGAFLSRARLEFDNTLGKPQVSVEFNTEGKKLFAKITRENVGKTLAIFLDGVVISNPVIQQEISSGNAQISGGFTVAEAKELVRNLNYGALPVPITLASTQTIGASLGVNALDASVNAGIMAFFIVGLFLIIWYRVPGVIATIALAIYTAINLAIFKLLPVTLTSAGIAGFILTLGMAVDANILIFERMKEELKRGKELPEAMKEGFARAWLSIRDSNLSSLITGAILFYFASTSVVKGFAFVFIIGTAVSMFTALTASRALLFAVGVKGSNKFSRFLFGSGIKN